MLESPKGGGGFKGSSAAASGAVTLGDLNINAPGGNAGLKWWQLALVIVIPGGLIVGAVWYFWKKRK